MPLQFQLGFPYWLKPFMGLDGGLTTFWFLTLLKYKLAVQIYMPLVL